MDQQPFGNKVKGDALAEWDSKMGVLYNHDQDSIADIENHHALTLTSGQVTNAGNKDLDQTLVTFKKDVDAKIEEFRKYWRDMHSKRILELRNEMDATVHRYISPSHSAFRGSVEDVGNEVFKAKFEMVDTLAPQMHKLTYDKLEKKYAGTQDNNLKLKGKNKALKERNLKVREQLDEQDLDLKEIAQKLELLELEHVTQQSRIDKFETTVEEQVEKIKHLEEQVNKLSASV
ncbi:hypothetical protein QBC44DRAFT_370785 [Cladorrhinum sp. PSN332]|nr:hypothetical protein QBC44DRAFT_370785 [Cladorrhinum sp. PSN332]